MGGSWPAYHRTRSSHASDATPAWIGFATSSTPLSPRIPTTSSSPLNNSLPLALLSTTSIHITEGFRAKSYVNFVPSSRSLAFGGGDRDGDWANSGGEGPRVGCPRSPATTENYVTAIKLRLPSLWRTIIPDTPTALAADKHCLLSPFDMQADRATRSA